MIARTILLKRSSIIALLLGGVLLLPLAGRSEDSPSDWSFAVSPYLWVAGIELETSLPAVPPSTPTVDQFDTRICAGAMLTAAAQYRSVGLFVDFAWLRLDTEALNPGPAFSAVNLRSDFIHTTAALTYQLPSCGKLNAEFLAGARVWHAEEELTFADGALPGFNSSSDETWADPILGAGLRYDLSPRWFLASKGTVGGFGVSADLAWEAFAGVGYHFNDWGSAVLGYRYLHEDYARDNFTFNLDTHGFLLGFGFCF